MGVVLASHAKSLLRCPLLYCYVVRFLRKFDVSDRDPSQSCRELADFACSLRRLFVEGYILCDGGGVELPGIGLGKTICQIAMEQCSDMRTFQYGDKVKTLWSKTSRQECEVSLAAIGSVVKDVLARLEADFHHNDLYLSLETMDLEAWRSALHASAASRGQPPAPEGRTLAGLRRKARRLCEALGLAYTFEAWLEVVQTALEHVKLVRQEMDLKKGDRVDNRMVWFRALSAQARGVETGFGSWTWVAPLIQFYLSVMDGTGAIERGLGRHADFLAAHVGAPEGGGVSASEACFEVCREGPQTEQEMFTKGPGDVLLLTDFSRQCASLWLVLHGRRFACSKVRANHGRTGTGWRLKGSMKATRCRQHAAADMLVEQAAADEKRADVRPRPTIIGVSRCRLMSGVAQQPPPTPTKTLLHFRRTTELRMAEKARGKVWVGHGPNPPKLRRGPEFVASTPTVAVQAVLAGKWLARAKGKAKSKAKSKASALAASQGAKRGSEASSGSALQVIEDVDAPDTPAKYRKVGLSGVEGANSIIVGSQDDLLKGDLSSELLEVWLGVLGLGKKVHTQAEVPGTNTGKTYAASASSIPAKVQFTEKFVRKHKRLHKSFNAVSSRPGSTWQAVPALASSQGAHKIGSTEDFRDFLLAVRRSAKHGVDCRYAEATTKGLAISRYGRPREAIAT